MFNWARIAYLFFFILADVSKGVDERITQFFIPMFLWSISLFVHVEFIFVLNHFESGLPVSDVEADFVLLLFFFYYFCEIVVANVVLSEAWDYLLVRVGSMYN